MLTRIAFRRVVFLSGLIAGVASAGDLLAQKRFQNVDKVIIKADKITVTIDLAGTAPIAEKAKMAPAAVSRELSMRPLPAYRINPPDVLQIEIVKPVGAGKVGLQSSTGPNQGTWNGTAGQWTTFTGVISDSATPTSDNPASQTFSGVISGSGFLVKSGCGTLTLGGASAYRTDAEIAEAARREAYLHPNIYSGGTTVSAGTLTLSGDVWGSARLVPGLSSGRNTATPGGPVAGAPGSPPGNFATGGGTVYQDYVAVPSGACGGSPGANVVSAETTLTLTNANGNAAPAAPPAGGQYLVGPDGTVNLRQYGTVQVMGQTVAEAKATLEKHLAKYLNAPQVTVEVIAFNSKVYYVVTQGAGLGDNVRRLPVTGNETVLDALANINGLSQLSSKRIWIARPSAAHPAKGTILRVDWDAITQGGATATNYQVLPGDRVFIAEDRDHARNNNFSRKTALWERVLGLIGLIEADLRGLMPLEGR